MLTHTKSFVAAQNCDKSIIYVPSYLILLSTSHGRYYHFHLTSQQIQAQRAEGKSSRPPGQQLPGCLTLGTCLHPSTTLCLHLWRESNYIPGKFTGRMNFSQTRQVGFLAGHLALRRNSVICHLLFPSYPLPVRPISSYSGFWAPNTSNKMRLCPQMTLPPGPASVHQTLNSIETLSGHLIILMMQNSK